MELCPAKWKRLGKKGSGAALRDPCTHRSVPHAIFKRDPPSLQTPAPATCPAAGSRVMPGLGVHSKHPQLTQPSCPPLPTQPLRLSGEDKRGSHQPGTMGDLFPHQRQACPCCRTPAAPHHSKGGCINCSLVWPSRGQRWSGEAGWQSGRSQQADRSRIL